MKAFYEQDANLDFLKNKTIAVTAARAMRMPRICVIPA